MKVLVACEFSGIVRDAFIAKGHNAMSCDLLPTERPGKHYQGDVREILDEGWDLMIAHPPCTYLANAGVQYMSRPERKAPMLEGASFFNTLLNADIPLICIENPLPHKYAREHIRKYDQIVRMNQFGEQAVKPTCLWLNGLKPLQPTSKTIEVKLVRYPNGRVASKWYAKLRKGHDRSRTFQGLADAMASQWGAINPTTPNQPNGEEE